MHGLGGEFEDQCIDLQVCTDVFLQYKVTNLLHAQEMKGKWEQPTNLWA